MRAQVLALALSCLSASACTRSHYHTEIPARQELRLAAGQGERARVRIIVERHWQDEATSGRGWNASEQVTATVSLNWIHLGPDPAPSVVELRGRGPANIAPQAVALMANVPQSSYLYADFDYARCQPRCVFEYELSWHHAPSGELRATFDFNAQRSAYKSGAIYRSNHFAYRVTVVPVRSPE